MNIGLVHVFCLDKYFFSSIAQQGCNLKFVSVPHFASQNIDTASLMEFWKDCACFDIASWNKLDHLNVEINIKSVLSSQQKLQVICQSERLVHISHLSIQERLLLIDQQEAKALNMLQALNLNHLAFGGFPHSMADYVLFLVASKIGVNISIHQDLPMAKGAHFLYDKNFVIQYANSITCMDEFKTNTAQNHRNIPVRTKTWKPKDERIDEWANTYRFLAANKDDRNAILNNLEETIESNDLAKSGLIYYTRWQNKVTPLDDQFNFNDCVVVYLHVEPESVVNPILGEHMPRQLDFLRRLRYCIDDSITLLIKEHPAMFLAAWSNPDINYSIYRSDEFLHEVSSFSNTYLLNAETKTPDLLRHKLACASIMGTVQNEALISGCPVISSKSSPLTDFPGVLILDETTSKNKFTQQNIEECRVILEAKGISEDTYISFIQRAAHNGSPNGEISMYYSFEGNELYFNSIQTAKSIVQCAKKSNL